MFTLRKSSDAHVVQQVLAGDRAAFATLVERYSGCVYGVAYAHIHNQADAEDITQDVFMRAFASLDTLRDRSRFGRWIISLAKNRSRDVLKRRRREETVPELAEHPVLEERPRPERQEVHALLREQMAGLEPDAREVLMLHYFAGKKIREIADLLNISRAAAAKRLQRARAALGERLVSVLGDELARSDDAKKRNQGVMAAIGSVPAAWEGVPTASGATASTGLATGTLTLAKVGGGIALVAAALVAIGLVHGRTAQHQSVVLNPPATQPSPIVLSETHQSQPATTPANVPQALTAALKNNEHQSAADVTGGAVTGMVRNEAGAPVPGVEVRARSTPTSNRHAESGPDGRFTIAGLAPGNHLYVQAVLEGTGRSYDARARTARVSAPAGPYRLTGAGVEDIELVLHPTGSIRGQLIDAAGRPVSGVQVSALQPTGGVYHPGPFRTGPDGVFEILGCAPDSYAIFANPPGTSPRYPDTALTEFTLGPAEHRTGLKLKYKPYLDLKGIVTDPSGRAVPGAEVRELRQAGNTRTNIEGRFELFFFSGGGDSPRLLVRHPDYYDLHYSIEDALTEIQLILEPRKVITGYVVNGRTREPVSEFAIVHSSGSMNDMDFIRSFAHSNTIHNAEGRFTIRPKRPGSLKVGVRAPGFSTLIQTIEPQQLDNEIVLALDPGSYLIGSVREATGKRVWGAKIYIDALPYGYLLKRDEKSPVTKTNWLGSFSLDNAPSGEHLIYAWHPDYPPAWKRFRAPQDEPVIITLSGGGILRGTMTIAGKPAQGSVSVFHRVPDIVGFSERTRRDGTYEITGVAPGAITVQASMTDRVSGVQFSLDQPAVIREGDVTVADVNFPEPSGASVEGQVRIGGELADRGSITAILPGGSTMGTGVKDEGRYRLDHVPLGLLTLDVRAYAGERWIWTRNEIMVDAEAVIKNDIDVQPGYPVSVYVLNPRVNERVSVRIHSGILPSPPVPSDCANRAMWPVGVAKFDGAAYVLSSVVPGTYTVVAEATHGAPLNEEEWLANTRSAIRVIVVGAEDVSVDLAFP